MDEKIDKEIKFLCSVIKAQAELLACYRLGRRPPERVHKVLDKYRKLYGNQPSGGADGI